MPLTANELKFGPQIRKRAGKFIVCDICGKTFYLTPARLARNERFCSSECSHKSHPRVIKMCKVCGKEFSTIPSMADRYTVCSMACRLANTKYIKCKRCGKLFNNPEKRYERNYCSEECRRPPIMIICKTCGKSFRKGPMDIDRQFCSFACYRRSKSETLPEKTVRKIFEDADIIFVQEAKVGRYSIDFLISNNIALEIDGTYWHKDKIRDMRKTLYLENKGIKVIRVTDKEIENSDNLAEFIIRRLQ